MISEATKLQATDAQAGIWYAHELDERKTAYNTGEYVEINGRINVSLLIESIKSTVQEADSLHITFLKRMENYIKFFKNRMKCLFNISM